MELWERTTRLAGQPSQLLAFSLALLATAAAVAAWRSGWARAALPAAALAVGVDFAWQFPGNANHQYLQLVCLALLMLLRDDVDDEVRGLLGALRWLLVLGLFHAGLQKLLYGHYFSGELLAFTIPQNPRFAAVLQHLMPAAEFERLARMTIQEGAGPFRVDSPMFLVVSTLAYVAELVLPVLLLVPATRRLAVWGTLAYFAAIESAAREVFFGGLMAGLALLFGPPTWLRRAQPVLYAGLAVLLATSLGLLPRWFFT